MNAQHAVSNYYIVGHYSTLTARDDRFRRVKVTLNEKIAAKLGCRQGYYADKKSSNFTAADRERPLEDALMQPNPITDLTIAMEVNYFQLNRAEYFVSIIPGMYVCQVSVLDPAEQKAAFWRAPIAIVP